MSVDDKKAEQPSSSAGRASSFRQPRAQAGAHLPQLYDLLARLASLCGRHCGGGPVAALVEEIPERPSRLKPGPRRLKSLQWLFLQAPPDNPLQHRRDRIARNAQLRGSSFRIAVMVSTAVSCGRRVARKHFVQNRSQGENVRTRIRRRALHLLGRHISTVPKTALRRLAQLPVLRHHQPKLPVLPASPNRNRESLPGRRA